MPTPGIVERFYLIEDVGASGVSGCVSLAVDTFFFQAGKETLHRRVVPAITAAAHAAGDSLGRQQALEVFARVLTALIRMVQQFYRLATSVGADRDLTRLERLCQS